VTGIALIGTGLMGRVHSHALRAACAGARLVTVCGRNRERLAATYGWETTTPDWREAVSRLEVGLVIVATRNADHAAAARAAIECGKAVLCEKPLAATVDEARDLRDAATGRESCGFNYRFVPALGLARDMIERGELGELSHVRSRFLMGSGVDGGWRHSPRFAGTGVVGDLASHHIDLVRWLAGEPVSVMASTRTLRPGETEDHAVLALELESGATAVLEASRSAGGHLLTSEIEVDGTNGTLAFSLQAFNELTWSRGADRRTIHATRPDDPDMAMWWPAGHPIGWDASFVHQARHMLQCVAGEVSLAPRAATFEDGYRCAAVCDAALRAAVSGRTVPVSANRCA
jgi:predicted dehydrogenase